ncbi:PRTase-like protein [Russula vinacea]|nr:PRTase-like protein [Russula vinacea]
MATEPKHFRITYNQVHNLIKRSAKEIADFKPIGFFPARVLRTFLKNPNTRGSVPIFAIGLSLYESIPGATAEQIGSHVIRTQWLGPETKQSIVGKRILIVDEVDDSRSTLQYVPLMTRTCHIDECPLDMHYLNFGRMSRKRTALAEDEREHPKTQFGVFVVHNKLKPKLGTLPADVSYFVGEEVGDLWLDYPWEATDIEEHDRLAQAQDP